MSSFLASRSAKSALTVFVLFCLFLSVSKLSFSNAPSSSWTQSSKIESYPTALGDANVYHEYTRLPGATTAKWPSPTSESKSVYGSTSIPAISTSMLTTSTHNPVPAFSSPPSDFEHLPSSTPKQKPIQLSQEEAETICQQHDFDVHPKRNQRKVYDLFLAGSEMEWLEIRLNTLDPVVDYFVIVESSKSFTYHPKPLYFKENYEKFEKFADKIIYRVLDFAGLENNSTWEREKFQRDALFNAVFPGLVGDHAASHDDVLIVSDLDEVPKEETVVMLKNCRFPERVTIRSQFYYYSFQWQKHGNDWNHPQATFYQGDKTVQPEDLRMGPGDIDLHNASWHCSSCLSTVAKMQSKIESFSHTEYDHARFKDPAQIVRRVRNGLDLFDREGEEYDKVDNNEDLPTYLKDHPDRFPWIVDRDPPNANFLDFDGEGAESLDEFTGEMNDKK